MTHGLGRVQFDPPDEPEVALLDYRTHQRRLMPLLARTYALHFAQASCSSGSTPPRATAARRSAAAARAT